MTLVLGSIGLHVRASAEADGWWLRPGSGSQADLSHRDGWPNGALDTPEGMTAALQVETLLDLEIADAVDGSIVVRWERFGELLNEEVLLPLRWTTWSPLMLAVDGASQIGRPDFEYRYSFRLGAREAAVDRVGYFVRRRITKQLFHLDEQTYALVEAIDRFNALEPNERKAAGWLTFATVKGCSASVGAALDAYLQDNDVVIPSQIALDVYGHEDGSISFVPKCPELPAKEFREAFLRNPDAQGLYSIDGADGKRVRVLLSDRHRQVLERMKQAKRLRGPAKEAAQQAPGRYFDGLLDAVEIEYGPRVVGVGEFQFVPVPTDPRESGGFFDDVPPTENSEADRAARTAPTGRSSELMLPGPEGVGDVRLTFADGRSLAMARFVMAEALAKGEPTVTIGEATVAVSQVALDSLQQEPARPGADRAGNGVSGNGSGQHGRGRQYLLVYTNETETVSADEEAAVQSARHTAWPTELRLPRALKPEVELKPHQRDALLWLQRCEVLAPHRRGVLLADDMGLGKTLQVLVHLARRIEDGALRATADTTHDGAPWRPILIVAPLILVENETWQNEMRHFFVHDGDLFEPVLVLHGAGVDKVRTTAVRGQETVLGRPVLNVDSLMQYRTVITSYETVVSYQHSLAQLKDGRPLWSGIVTDEAQRYKVPNTKVSHALKAIAGDFHIASTGTPVENRLLDLWNIMDTIQPALLGTAHHFSDAFERPLGTESAGEALSTLRQRLLFGEPHAFIMRRTKAELLDLPPKGEERLLCDMSPAERAAHQELLAALTQERRAGRHLAVLHRLGALYQHPALLRGEGASLAPAALLAESSKLRAVVEKLREIERHGQKAIVFARLLEVQQILAQVFQSEFGRPVPIINGATSRGRGYKGSTASTGRAKEARKRILKEFRDQAGFGVLILSPQVAGIGLTITETNHVFHYGRWWNPAVEAQATDRAYRIGQTRPVTVYLPILRDPSGSITATFDQRLDDLMRRKANLAQDFLHPSDNEGNNAAELCDMLEADAAGVASSTPGAPFTGADLDRLDPHDFEAVVAALYQADGYWAILTARAGDGGADVLAIRDGELVLIRVKHSRGRTGVDERAVSDVLAACDVYGQRLGVRWRAALVSNGPMTPRAVREASHSGVELVAGDRLVHRIAEHRIGLGAMAACAAARCTSFDEGVRQARLRLQDTTVGVA